MAMKKYLIITLLSIFWLSVLLSCTETKKSLNIGGFEFGASKQEALVRAASLGYEIKPVGDYNLWLSGIYRLWDYHGTKCAYVLILSMG